MKYIVLVGDGMADLPIKELGERTPLEIARTPNMDYIAKQGMLGKVKTIPDKMSPASDVANLAILGYDPKQYYTGRGPLEAANLGVELKKDDIAFRCNLVTVTGDIMEDYSAGHISSSEARLLINYLDEKLGDARIRFYSGVSYRHLMVVRKGAAEFLQNIVCKPPHDITGESISKNMPNGDNAQLICSLMEQSRSLLEAHEINQVRVDLQENPANMIWLWGQGLRPSLPLFREKYGVTGSVISAVDLIKGIGRLLGLDVLNVAGATGYYDTNYEGKAQAALKSLRDNDFVFVHVEAPDEAGHNGDLREKITAIERFDQFIVGNILQAFKGRDDFRVLVLPDHPTPIALKTHTSDPVCFGIFGKGVSAGEFSSYCEKEADKSGLYFDSGEKLIDFLIKGSKGE